MGSATIAHEKPASQEEAADLLRRCAEAGTRVRPLGAGTKAGWGNADAEHDLELRTGGLASVVEHNEGDLTAVIEAGTPLSQAQAGFAEAGQMVALDPPLGEGEAATIGGVLATGDSGPMRHRYGAARDLVVGMRMALSDGTVAKSGGKVIKNVAGYDLAKLMSGSFGTLGLILEVAVRLHPRPASQATAHAACDEPAALGRAASALAHSHLEMQCLDAGWSGGRGDVLARFGGATAAGQAQAAAGVLRDAGLEGAVVEDDEPLWARQRAGQRSAEGVVVRVAGLQSELPRIALAADRAGASLVGRAGLGIFWLKLERQDAAVTSEEVEELRAGLAPRQCVVLDAPDTVRGGLDVWDERDPARIELARRVKQRFDPGHLMSPGVFLRGV
jgi:glycolate dehydrogenase FAD-binding subunit